MIRTILGIIFIIASFTPVTTERGAAVVLGCLFWLWDNSSQYYEAIMEANKVINRNLLTILEELKKE